MACQTCKEKGLIALAKKVAQGEIRLHDPEIIGARLEVCESCPELTKAIRVCRRCLCQVDVKARIDLNSCPLGKWPR